MTRVMAAAAAFAALCLVATGPASAQVRTNDPDPADIQDRLLEELQSAYYDMVDGSLRRAQRPLVNRIPMRAVTSRGGSELVDVRYSRATGDVLTDATGRTLYATRLDRIDGKSSLSAGQLQQWLPLTVSAEMQTRHLWGKAWNEAAQVWVLTIAGKPLYTYAGDTDAGQANGRGPQFYTLEVIN